MQKLILPCAAPTEYLGAPVNSATLVSWESRVCGHVMHTKYNITQRSARESAEQTAASSFSSSPASRSQQRKRASASAAILQNCGRCFQVGSSLMHSSGGPQVEDGHTGLQILSSKVVNFISPLCDITICILFSRKAPTTQRLLSQRVSKLLMAIGTWSAVPHDEIYMFDNGCWAKFREL